MVKKRIFVSFAVEDVRYRDFLVGQSKHDDSPFEFMDMSVKEPWDHNWKVRCRTKIKGCDGVIALLSDNSAKATGALWEMKCANEEEIKMIGVHIMQGHVRGYIILPAREITALFAKAVDGNPSDFAIV